VVDDDVGVDVHAGRYLVVVLPRRQGRRRACADRPSHILVSAIHRNRAGIRDIFQREMPDVDPAPTDDPPCGPRRPAATCAASSCPPGHAALRCSRRPAA
jgi:hypothetical protein